MGLGLVGIIEVLNVGVEVKANARGRRESSLEAAMPRRRPLYESLGMLMVTLVRRDSDAVSLEVGGRPRTWQRWHTRTGGVRCAKCPSGTHANVTGHHGCEGQRNDVQKQNGSHASGRQQG